MSHNCEKYYFREEKRQEKKRHREAKRELKQRLREEKRLEKQRRREEKRKHRDDLVARFFNLSLSEPSRVVEPSNLNSNVYYNHINENEVATLRTIFPDCDPTYIRSCLANESAGNEGVRKVVEKLLTTNYPKVIPVTPSTPPTAPPLNLTRNSFDDEAPPSYEEALGGQPLQPPPLPSRHQRSSSWGGNGTSQSRNLQYENPHFRNLQYENSQSRNSQSSRDTQFSQISQNLSRGAATASTEVTEAVGAAFKTVFDNFKPSTVEHACLKYSYIWSRPVPSWFKYKSFSYPIKVSPKDKFSIQKGFNQSNYPSKQLRSRDISERDWYSFMSGLNSIIGVNSIKGNNNINHISVGLKWVSWTNMATMDESLMETNIKVLNEYISYWNDNFFNPRRIVIQLIDDRNQYGSCEQYLLVKSI